MVTTRSNRQKVGAERASPASSQGTVGSKRKAEDSEGGPKKRGRKASLKQTTIEDSLNGEAMDVDKPEKVAEDKQVDKEPVAAKSVDQEPLAAEKVNQEPVEEQNIEAKVAESEKLIPEETGQDTEMKDAPSEEAQVESKAEKANGTLEPEISQEKQQPETQSGAISEVQPTESRESAKQPEPVGEAQPAAAASEPAKEESTGDIEHDSAAQKPREASGDTKTEQEGSKEQPRQKEAPHTEPKEPTTEATSSKSIEAKDAVQTGDKKREETTPSTILEKGLIYFFFRGRVGIDSPSEVNEIARSYIILRPIPHDAKLTDGKIADGGKNRVLALPKKVLPQSGKDKFMTFVEKTNIGMDEIKDTVLKHNDYETKTVGTRHSPAAIPIGEGVYAISSTGTTRDTHLSYMLTIPSKLSEVQRDVGLKEKASFVANVKNPKASSPQNAALPKGADYPKEIQDDFRSLNWAGLKPTHLDYENTQILLIGNSSDDLKELLPGDKLDKKEDHPAEEIEKLEHEDELRVEHLKGDDSVFVDLGLSHKEYSQIPTTW